MKIFTKILYSLGFRVIACGDLHLWPLITKATQHHEPICDKNWVIFPSLVCEIWCPGIASCDLDLWSFDLITMSQALQVHTWPKFGEISSNIYDAQTHALTHRRTDPNAVCLRHRFPAVAEAEKRPRNITVFAVANATASDHKRPGQPLFARKDPRTLIIRTISTP